MWQLPKLYFVDPIELPKRSIQLHFQLRNAV